MPILSFFSRFTAKPGTAYAKWKTHFEAAKAGPEEADRYVAATHNRLRDEMDAAQNAHASSGSAEDWSKFQSATHKFRQNEQAFQRWANRSCYGAAERIEVALDVNLLKDAVREVEHEIEAGHASALAAFGKVAEEAGIDLAAARKDLDEKYRRRIAAIRSAEVAIENIKVTDRSCSPRGCIAADSFLAGALQP